MPETAMDDISGEYAGMDGDGACTVPPSASMIAMMSLSLGGRLSSLPTAHNGLTRAALTFASFVKTITTKAARTLPPYDTFMSTADDRLETRA